jgi:hypothetical protein
VSLVGIEYSVNFYTIPQADWSQTTSHLKMLQGGWAETLCPSDRKYERRGAVSVAANSVTLPIVSSIFCVIKVVIGNL